MLINLNMIHAEQKSYVELLKTLEQQFSAADDASYKTMDAVEECEMHPEKFSDEEADAIYAAHEAAMRAFKIADEKLKAAKKIADLLDQMEEEVEWYDNCQDWL